MEENCRLCPLPSPFLWAPCYITAQAQPGGVSGFSFKALAEPLCHCVEKGEVIKRYLTLQ